MRRAAGQHLNFTSRQRVQMRQRVSLRPPRSSRKGRLFALCGGDHQANYAPADHSFSRADNRFFFNDRTPAEFYSCFAPDGPKLFGCRKNGWHASIAHKSEEPVVSKSHHRILPLRRMAAIADQFIGE